MKHYLYITSNFERDKFFIDFTDELDERIQRHGVGIFGPKSKRECTDLVYLEVYDRPGPAICRSVQLQDWDKESLKKLISAKNPNFRDLGAEWLSWNDRSILKGMLGVIKVQDLFRTSFGVNSEK